MRPRQLDAYFDAFGKLRRIAGAEPKQGCGNAVVEREQANVLTAHKWIAFLHMLCAECSYGNLAQAFGKDRVVEDGGGDFRLAYIDDRHAVRRYVIGDGHSVSGLTDSGDDLVAHRIAVRSQRQPHRDFLWNNVALQSA